MTWDVLDETLPVAGALYGPQRSRMALFGLGGGGLLIVSPGVPRGGADGLWDGLARWGTPRFLLAPNHFHNAGIAAWKQRFPDARVCAHEAAIPRLRKQVPGVAFEGLEGLAAALPAGVRLLSPPQAKQGETWVSAETPSGRLWFVVDGIVNEERLPGGLTGLFLRAVGFRTELMTNPFFKRLFLRDRAAYKAWVRAELERDRPTIFLPAHGAVLRGPDVWERLAAVTDAG